MSLGGITNLDYTVLLCNRMDETRAFYRDIMKFPIETDLKHWVSFRVGAALLTLRPRTAWSVCDDGKAIPGSAAVQLAFRVPPPAVDACHAELVSRGVTPRRQPQHPRSSAPRQSPSRTLYNSLAGPLEAGLAIAKLLAHTDPHPRISSSQPPFAEVLRRPVESAQYSRDGWD